MFTYKRYDECQDAGLSLDYISDDLKNEFYYSVNVSGLDDVIYVVFTDHSVLFCKKSEELSQLEEGEVLASISLTDIKETGHDLLFFAEDAKFFFPKEKEVTLEGNDGLESYLKKACEIYKAFPFAKKLKKELDRCKKSKNGGSFSGRWEKQNQHPFQQQVSECFLKFCLLEFISVVDTHAGIFAIYPKFDELRAKLRASKVFRLLKAKLSYYSYRYKGERETLNDDELTYLVGFYSDLLMDSDYNKVVPPAYYDGNSLLKNPEEELAELVGGSGLLRHKNKAKINHSTEQKIQSFFFTKHSVLNGVLRCRWLYFILLILMGIWSIGATFAFFMFDDAENSFVDWFFDNIIWWDWLAVFAIIVLSILALLNKSINVFSLRILVTIAIGWITAFISEDLVKSQLEIDPNLVLFAWTGIMVVIIALIFSEVKQHSPYYNLKFWKWDLKFWKWDWKFWKWDLKFWYWDLKFWRKKICPTMVYSYFWALTVGVLMQFALYDDLLKNSNALSDIVYKENIEKADTYFMYLNEFKDALADYKETSEEFFLALGYTGNINARTKSEGTDSTNVSLYLSVKNFYNNKGASQILKPKIQAIDAAYSNLMRYMDTVAKEDSAKIDLELLSFGATINLKAIDDSIRKVNNLDSISKANLYAFIDGRIHYPSELINAYWKVFENTNPDDIKVVADVSSRVEYIKEHSDSVSDSLLFYKVNELINSTKIEIKQVKFFIANSDNWDTLIDWSDCLNRPVSDSILNSIYAPNCYVLQNQAKKHNLCRKVYMWWPPEKNDSSENKDKSFFYTQKRLYPRMLLFHTLIVLIIAFVGQLIVSDKSVTEPL